MPGSLKTPGSTFTFPSLWIYDRLLVWSRQALLWFPQDMQQHDREGILAGMLPDATAKMLAIMPRAMAIDALQTLIPPIAQQVTRIYPHAAASPL